MSMRGRHTASLAATCRYAVSNAAMGSAIVSTLPTSSLLMIRVIHTRRGSDAFRQRAFVILVEKFRQHAALNAFLGDHLLPILFYLGVFHPIRNRGAAFGN